MTETGRIPAIRHRTRAAEMMITVTEMKTNDIKSSVRSPLAGWVGGKYQLCRHIIPLIPDHACYAEPFAGAAWVLFRKPQSASEVINDINHEIVTLYRVIQHHLEEFVRYFKWVLVSREEFKRYLESPPNTLTDIQRSARFFYIHHNAFAGWMDDNPTFGYATNRTPKLNLLRIEEDLSAAHLRLSQVYIENLPYHDLIRRYDRPETFFYVDPPYWNCEDYYGDGIFSKEDFHRLADILAAIKGKFLLSLNDTPQVREIFQMFEIGEVAVRYSCSTGKPTPARELLIRNY